MVQAAWRAVSRYRLALTTVVLSGSAVVLAVVLTNSADQLLARTVEPNNPLAAPALQVPTGPIVVTVVPARPTGVHPVPPSLPRVSVLGEKLSVDQPPVDLPPIDLPPVDQPPVIQPPVDPGHPPVPVPTPGPYSPPPVVAPPVVAPPVVSPPVVAPPVIAPPVVPPPTTAPITSPGKEPPEASTGDRPTTSTDAEADESDEPDAWHATDDASPPPQESSRPADR